MGEPPCKMEMLREWRLEANYKSIMSSNQALIVKLDANRVMLDLPHEVIEPDQESLREGPEDLTSERRVKLGVLLAGVGPSASLSSLQINKFPGKDMTSLSRSSFQRCCSF